MTRTLTPQGNPSASNGRASVSDSVSELAARWGEARHAYPIYAALAQQFSLARSPHPDGELPPVRPTREIFDRDMRWMDELDQRIKAVQLRQLLPDALNTSEESLRCFTLRQLRKENKDAADRDKIDFLIVQYFALCAPDRLYHEEIHLKDVADVIKPVLPEADPTPLEWCEPLEEILNKVNSCRSLRDLMERGLLEQARLLKESAGDLFYDPAALVAFCRFNFLLRRNFILLLHADQKAVLDAISRLDTQGVKIVDARRAGFSAAEPIRRVRQFAESWRQPYHKDYGSTSVSRAFEQLLALRADLEEAVGPKSISGAEDRSAANSAQSNDDGQSSQGHVEARTRATQVTEASQESPSTEQEQSSNPGPAQAIKPPRETKNRPKLDSSIVVPATTQAEIENFTEAIWEQLIDTPPSRGRSMSTIVLKDTKVLLSSWEVAAFVGDGGPDADDLRRAVVARALLAVSIDGRKRSGNSIPLESALMLARSEVSYFQGKVEQSKRAKNTEAAVNLGISTKRLLSVIEEAESLQA